MIIKDILTIDLSEDIKNVIDLEDLSEAEIKSEIENYIITDGLAKEFSDFVGSYTDNILETGAWISGFYGSGKSYFGKLLGYMLSNKNILGTPARDRIMQRFTGITDEALVRNELSKLSSEKSRVVFLDVAKQDTSKGLSYTLFRNFLKSLSLPENEHGFFLFQLLVNENQINIHEFVKNKLNKNWDDIKTKLLEYVKAAKTIYLNDGNTESEYTNMITTIRREIDQFSAASLKDELENYLKIAKDEKIVFLFDEASEALNQGKFDLLELEGVSEALSALGGNVWTIAIAQEKLDDVISNSNFSKSELVKVTDRFKTKIHLEATEVDVIIRNRLLKKTNSAVKDLEKHYKSNSGKISDHAALTATGLEKTETAECYFTYYPFYKCQFGLMQNFLFGTKGYASTKVAARGMIITTYDILKRELQNQPIFDTVSGWQIAKQAQPQPPVRLVNRYDNAERVLKQTGSIISGRKLLETLQFLTESEVVHTTLSNIVKSYINNADDAHKIQPEIQKALDHLLDTKLILFSNNTYKITSDIEQRLLDEMNGFTVQGFVKKKQIISIYKSCNFIKNSARITDSNLQYDFYITTDNDDELTRPALKHLNLKVKNIYNISDDRNADIEAIKNKYQNDKDTIWIVPDNKNFKKIDKLLEDIEKITYLEQKYNNPQSEEGQILRSFSTSKSEKENHVKDLIEQSLQKATSVYLYNTFVMDTNNWQTKIQEQERQVIRNVYTKRLDAQLSDSIAAAVIKEADNTRLKSYFNGNDFAFFNNKGNFIGENLKSAEEILFKIRNTFVVGKDIEEELMKPPTGFTFGTVISTVAALFRGGKVVAKYNGESKFSWRDPGVKEMFSAAREFRKASFKAISKSLSPQQKKDIVDILIDLDCEKHINKKIDWNTNDFELIKSIKELSKHICDKVEFLQKQTKDFDSLFTDIEKQKDFLSGFTGDMNESNYIDKAEIFLKNTDDYMKSVKTIEKIEKFIKNNLPKILKWNKFVNGVNDEIVKAGVNNDNISALTSEFINLYEKQIVKNFSSLNNTAQQVKDAYYELMKKAAEKMSSRYKDIAKLAKDLIKEIKVLPEGLNEDSLTKTNNILLYSNQRTNSAIEIDFDVKDKISRFTYSEMLSFIDLATSKSTELEVIKAGLVKTAPPKPKPGKPTEPVIKNFSSELPSRKMKVSEYKNWLKTELQKVAGADDNDEIEIKG